jgi:hypothetical protein
MPGYPCHAPFGPVQIRSRQICHAWLSLPRLLRASANLLPADLRRPKIRRYSKSCRPDHTFYSKLRS